MATTATPIEYSAGNILCKGVYFTPTQANQMASIDIKLHFIPYGPKILGRLSFEKEFMSSSIF